MGILILFLINITGQELKAAGDDADIYQWSMVEKEIREAVDENRGDDVVIFSMDW